MTTRFVTYTLVDVKTKIPVSEAPAKNGPTHPPSVVPTFAIEETFPTQVPKMYGIVTDDDYTESNGVEFVTEEEFYQEFQKEMRTRIDNVKENGFEVAPDFKYGIDDKNDPWFLEYQHFFDTLYEKASILLDKLEPDDALQNMLQAVLAVDAFMFSAIKFLEKKKEEGFAPEQIDNAIEGEFAEIDESEE